MKLGPIAQKFLLCVEKVNDNTPDLYIRAHLCPSNTPYIRNFLYIISNKSILYSNMAGFGAKGRGGKKKLFNDYIPPGKGREDVQARQRAEKLQAHINYQPRDRYPVSSPPHHSLLLWHLSFTPCRVVSLLHCTLLQSIRSHASQHMGVVYTQAF